ncbi:MAG: hypothetical protein Q8K07_09755 [Methylicorpusculum sp.]|uniref:hypothetical protein n=1 Tax=Methylicorpusculum sp. TaxID=2713644 RepID=UPI0027307DA5|nr:hypothetical protein [Methylicorpusculum sp.]MDP2202291.1 hypothetical protein [Methylicorpusculum sp.]
MSEIDFELDLPEELPPVRTFIDGELVELDTESQAIAPISKSTELSEQASLHGCLQDFGLLDMSAHDLIAVGVEELNASMVKACKAGVAFWAAQEALKLPTAPGAVGNFKHWIDKSGLVERRVYECIKLAKYYARLPESQRSKVLTIGKKQALLLAKMPQEVIDRASENGTDLLEEAEMMTYDQLRDLLKAAERKTQNLNAIIENRDAVISKLKNRQPQWQFDPKTHIVRDECLVYQAECEVALNSLEALFTECLNDLVETEKAMRIEQVFITATVVAARAAEVVHKLKKHAAYFDGVDLPESISSKHTLTDDEAERWLLDYQSIERKAYAAKALREQKREEAKPKGPGRPKNG